MEMRPVDILLVEDNPGDVILTEEALQTNKVVSNLHVAWDGEEAMGFLRQEGDFANAPRPDVILLDLNLPRMDGREVLRAIKTDENLKRIPVVILTTSEADKDLIETYTYHANCYVTKPLDLRQFMSVVKGIESFWLSIVKLPPK